MTALPGIELQSPGPGLITLDPVRTALLRGLDDLLSGLAARPVPRRNTRRRG